MPEETKEKNEEKVETQTQETGGVQVLEKEAAGLIAEIKSRIRDKDSSMSDEKLKGMIQEAVKQVMSTQRGEQEALVRKGEFASVDADPGKEFRRTGKLSQAYSFKNIVTGMAPRRWYKRFEGELKDIYDMNDELLIVSKVLRVAPTTLRAWSEYEEVCKEFAKKALVSTVSGSGDEYVPTNFSSQLVDKVRLEMKVAALHSRIPMTSNPFTLPLEGADATAFLAAETTVDATEAGRITASTPSTANVTFTAKKLATRSVFSEEINEDSIIGILEFVRNKIAVALANATETATINGDDSGTHMDQDVTTSTDAKKAWKGYRKHAKTAAGRVDAGGDALDAADMRNCRKNMGKYGVNPRDLAWVVGVTTYHQMLSETDSNGFSDFRTLDKLGPQATVLTGQLGAFDGIPVIVSEFVKENLAADGDYDGTTTNLSAITLVNRGRYMFGDRRSVTLRSFEDIQTDQQVMVIKQRLDFQPMEATTNVMVNAVYNILTG